MKTTQIRALSVLAETRYRLAPLHEAPGSPDSFSPDDHLKAAHHHAQAHLNASRAGDAETAQHHASQANHHLMQARTKERAEMGQGQPGMKMVFGAWRKVGQKLSPEEHTQLAGEHKKLAHRQKLRTDARAMMAGTHPSEIPDDQKATAYADVHDHLHMAAAHMGLAKGAHDYDPHGDPSQTTPAAKARHDTVMTQLRGATGLKPPSPSLHPDQADPHAHAPSGRPDPNAKPRAHARPGGAPPKPAPKPHPGARPTA